MNLHWIDDADHWECPICGAYVTSPSVYTDCRCPVCGFQDQKDNFLEETLLEPPKDEWFNKCPICGYKLRDCQCLVSGNAHPDRWKKIKVIKDHLYLLNSVELHHVIWLERQWQMSYTDPEMTDILNEVKGEHQC